MSYFKSPVTLDIHASTSYYFNVAYLIVNYRPYEESFIAFPICSCLYFAINIFPPICNSEAVTLTLMLMAYIMLLFHYSARFLKNIKSPFCRCSYSLTADLLIFCTKNKLRHPPSPSQLQFRNFKNISINWVLSLSPHSHSPNEGQAIGSPVDANEQRTYNNVKPSSKCRRADVSRKNEPQDSHYWTVRCRDVSTDHKKGVVKSQSHGGSTSVPAA